MGDYRTVIFHNGEFRWLIEKRLGRKDQGAFFLYSNSGT